MGVISKYIWMNIKAASEYRLDFIISNISMMATNAIFLGTVIFLSHSFNGIGGLTYQEFLAGMIIGHFSFVIGLNFFPGTRHLQSEIISGDLDKLLMRPISFYKHSLIYRFSPYFIGEILTLIALLTLVDPSWLPFILIFSVFGGIMMHAATLFYSCLPFFIEHNYENPSFDMIISFLTYPPDIFAGAIKYIALYVFPGGIIAFGPLILLKNPWFAWVYFGFTAFTVLACWAALHFGLKKYKSVGY